MKTLNLKQGLLFALIATSVIACKKKEETKTPDPVVETPTVTCFNSNNNGTYIGSGVTTAAPYTSGTLTVTRTDCQNVTLNLVTDIPSQIISQITQVTLNANGSYDGKQSNNNNISLSFGSSLSVNAISSFTFSGLKQP